MKMQSTNPSENFKVIGSVTISSEKDIINAVKKAQKAKSQWKNMLLSDRIKYFKRLITVYKKRSKEVAELQSKEMGKPIKESLDDVSNDMVNISNKIDLAIKYLTPIILDISKTQKNVLYYEPHGVAAVIAPWNFPSGNFFISNLQLLLSGNAVVFKHSEECPLTGKLLEEIMQEAGFPDGVFSEIYGDGKVGDFLTDQEIDVIHFTGSSKVGKLLYEKAAKKFIPVILEMGGSSPGIIFKDADLDQVCRHACMERFTDCGQVCCALKRLIVHNAVFEDVVNRMKNRVESMVIGNALSSKTDIGPLVAKRQLDLLVEQVEDAKKKGAIVITGGKRPKNLDGAYYEPTILTNIKPDMRVVTEEVFGPVLPILSFKMEEEAIKLANNTPYGLSAFVYGKDIKQIYRVVSQIEAGQISINGASYFSKHSPFGGYKQSGMGRNDGAAGFYEATRKKVVAEPV